MSPEYYTTTTTTSSGDAGALLGVYLIVLLLFALPGLIATWKLFQKAGKPGWAAIVPFYNTVVMLQIAKQPIWYFVMLFIPFVNFIFAILVLVGFIKAYRGSVGFWVAYILFPLVSLFLIKNVEYSGDVVPATTGGPVAPTSPVV